MAADDVRKGYKTRYHRRLPFHHKRHGKSHHSPVSAGRCDSLQVIQDTCAPLAWMSFSILRGQDLHEKLLTLQRCDFESVSINLAIYRFYGILILIQIIFAHNISPRWMLIVSKERALWNLAILVSTFRL